MLKPFLEFIKTLLPDLVIGQTLHAGWLPQKAPDKCSVVMERTSGHVDLDKPSLREKPIQVLTRAPTYFEARDEATRIFDTLIEVVSEQLDGWWIHAIKGMEPQYIGQDEKGRHEFSTNLVVLLAKEVE